MRRRSVRALAVLFVLLFLGAGNVYTVYANSGGETDAEAEGREDAADIDADGGMEIAAAGEKESGKGTDGSLREEEEKITDSLLDEIGVDGIQDFLDGQDDLSDVSFSDLVLSLIEGEGGTGWAELGEWIKNALFGEFTETRGLFVQIIVISIAFGILRNFTDIFDNSYISELCFVLVYGILAILLMKSFLVLHTLTKDTLNTTVDFMKTLIPVYCMSMMFSNGTATAAAFYELTFIILYLVQWMLLDILLPLVQVMVIFVFMNGLLEGEKFQKITELIEDGVSFILKFILSAVVGLNVIQGLIRPAADKFKGSIASKTASAIPGVGNSIRSVSEIIVSAGTLVKNSVGVAAMLILFAICLFPVLKMGVMTFFYKLSAAVVEPVADKRIAGTMNGVCRGSVLLAKILLTSVLMFLLTIAMVTASTSFIY